jgi:hypothetical protein
MSQKGLVKGLSFGIKRRVSRIRRRDTDIELRKRGYEVNINRKDQINQPASATSLFLFERDYLLTVFSRNARIALVSGTCPEMVVFAR